MFRVDMNIAIITNMVAPYRVPLFRALAKHEGVEQLTVLVCADRESDRQWTVHHDASFAVRKLRGHTIERSAGGDRRRIVHLRWEVLTWLWWHRPDRVLIGDASWTSYLATVACRLARLKYWVWSEITPASKVNEGLTARARRWMYRGARGCIAASQEAQRFLMSQGVPVARIHQATNAIDHDALQAEAARLRPHARFIRQELGITEGAFVFLFVGQLISRKRVIETMAELEKAAASRPIHFVVAGDGPLEGALRHQAEACEHLKVSFAGYVENESLWRLYAAADSLILLSDDEPWGMVISEALAFGLPFLASSSVAAAVEFQHLGRLTMQDKDLIDIVFAHVKAGHDTRSIKKNDLPRPEHWVRSVFEAFK